MIHIWEVIDTLTIEPDEKPEVFATYLNPTDAHDLAGKADWWIVNHRAIDEWPNSKVFVLGQVIGFQFSRTTQGGRTFRRKISNLHYEHDDDGKPHVVGQIEVYGRIVEVLHVDQYAGLWGKAREITDGEVRGWRSEAEWITTKRIGWTDD